MCGIFAAISSQNIVPFLIEGLRGLEYRGYDSCGIAINKGEKIICSRSVGRVEDLARKVKNQLLDGKTGIAHTRWATHGGPDIKNAHPIVSNDEIAIVHNGIIENYESLRDDLIEEGYTFTSQTDTEVLAHLIHKYYNSNLLEAVQAALTRVRGSFAIAVISKFEPNRVVAARQGSPMVIGVGDKKSFVASDPTVISEFVDRIIFLQEGDIVDLTDSYFKIYFRAKDNEYIPVERRSEILDKPNIKAELGTYRHYMQKEIFEQPKAIENTLEGILDITASLFGDKAESVFPTTDRVLFLACGTSYYACLTAKYWIEEVAHIPCDVEIASEYRYRHSISSPRTLVVTVSQSGETADTLAALAHAKRLGMVNTLTICNSPSSTMVRESSMCFITRAGVEIGVASTKAFTTQLVALYLLAIALGRSKGSLHKEQIVAALKELQQLPHSISVVLALESQIIAWAEQFAQKEHALFLGRGMHYPIALEGALKLKEISYIHAEAYPAGELKHGPLALVDSDMLVVALAPNDGMLEKLKSNMQEVRARGGILYVCASRDSHIVNSDNTHVINLPENKSHLSPILQVIPLQLLAYHTAVQRGADVDKPRNLAKSVTVE